MEFVTNVSRLKTEVNLLNGIAERKSGVAALSSLLIETTKTGIRMTGTDLDTTVQVEFPATIKAEGSICIPAKKLCDIVKSLDSGEVKIKKEANDWARLTCGTSKHRFAGMAKDNFPDVPVVEAEEVTVDGELLKNLIKKTCFAITQEEGRYVLSGAKLEVENGTIRMVATDGHRISLMSDQIDDIEATLNVLIPKKALTEVVKFAGNEVVITNSQNHIKFESGDRILISRKIVGNFPNYVLALPKGNEVEVSFAGDEMTKALRRVSKAADEVSKAVKFEVTKDQILLSATSAGEGESEDVVKCKTKKLPEDGLTIYLNWQYMTEFLAICEKPYLRLKDGLSAAEIVDGTALCVVMPLRANG